MSLRRRLFDNDKIASPLPTTPFAGDWSVAGPVDGTEDTAWTSILNLDRGEFDSGWVKPRVVS